MAISSDSSYINHQLKIRMMIERYRTSAHQFSKTDPLELGRNNNFIGAIDSKVLEPQSFGLS